MSLHHRYIQDVDGVLYDFWWNTNADGRVTAVTAEPTPLDNPPGVDPADIPVPPDCAELTETDYNAAVDAQRTARRTEFEQKRRAMEDRRGVLNNLINSADSLLGGIL